jgi:ATP-dependent 26S proteasome regulatory subunit
MPTPTATPIQQLDRYIRARYSIIGVVTHEERRVLEAVRKLAANKRRIVEWSLTRGFTTASDGLPSFPEESQEPLVALDYISTFDQDSDEKATLFVFKDLHNILSSDIKVLRYLRDIAVHFESRPHNVILISPILQTPADLDKDMVLIDWPLPAEQELTAILTEAEADLANKNVKLTLNGNRDQVIQAMLGLTETEARNTLSAAVVTTLELGPCVIPIIVKEKAQIIRKSGILEFYDTSITMNEVGGLQHLKEYAAIKRNAFSALARAAHVDAPKGVLLVGVPGTGKSLAAKAIAGGQMPLLRMDVGKLLGGGHVGEGEGNTRAALKVAEAVAPCVLWLDEIEKGMADNGGASDGGVMMRVFGTLLTWMQETTAPVYVVATANDVRSLRPELLRRFDDVLWVGLPDAKSRMEILKVHLDKRQVFTISTPDLELVVAATWGFSGAEIEKVVKAAVEMAFFEQIDLTIDHLQTAAAKIVPISVTKKDQIDDLLSWAQKHGVRPAGDQLEPQPIKTPTAKRTIDIG